MVNRWTSRPSAGWWLSYPNLVGAVVLSMGGGAPVDSVNQTAGALSGTTPPSWGRPDPTDLQPTVLFTNGGSLNSYANFGAKSAFLNLGVNTPMTLIARIRWTGGTGGIAERTSAGVGWAWGVGSNNGLVFLKVQSTGTQGRADHVFEPSPLVSGEWTTVAVTYAGEAAGVNGGSIVNYKNGVAQAGGDNRTGSGTNGSDAAASFRLGNSSIDMPGAGNPALAGSFGGQIAWILAFNRVLSAGELRAFSYTRGVPGEMWGQLAVVPRRARFVHTPTPDGMTIDGTARDILQRWSISEQLNERGTMRFGVKSMDASYRPELRDVIDFRKFSIHFFAGHIHHTEEGALARVPYGVVPIETQCGAADFNALPDRRQVAMTLASGTLKSQLITAAAFLSVYGVTVDPAQVDGPSMPDMDLTTSSLTAVLEKLSVSSGYAWNISYDKVISMFAPGTVAAPFDIEDNDARVKGDVLVSPTTVEYGNYITVRWTEPARKAYDFFELTDVPSADETVTVASTVKTWKASPSGPNEVQIGANVVDSIDNLVASLAGHAEIIATVWDTGIMNVEALVAGAAGNSIQVATTCVDGVWFGEGHIENSHLSGGLDPALTGVAIAQDIPAQDGGANLYEKEYPEPTVTNQDAADALAAGYLAQSLVQPREIRYRTRLHGLHPGMQQQIQVTGRNVDGPCLITQVEISPEGSALINYDVTAIEGLQIVQTTQGQWRQMQGAVA